MIVVWVVLVVISVLLEILVYQTLLSTHDCTKAFVELEGNTFLFALFVLLLSFSIIFSGGNLESFRLHLE